MYLGQNLKNSINIDKESHNPDLFSLLFMLLEHVFGPKSQKYHHHFAFYVVMVVPNLYWLKHYFKNPQWHLESNTGMVPIKLGAPQLATVISKW